MRGFIDRVDVEGKVTAVRDLTTGKSYPRARDEAGPVPWRDVQLGLYCIVASKLAGAWGKPSDVEPAYAYADGRGAPERAFGADARDLVSATEVAPLLRGPPRLARVPPDPGPRRLQAVPVRAGLRRRQTLRATPWPSPRRRACSRSSAR